MSIDRLEAEFVEAFPATMEPGVLYVSLEYRTCGHLCACGCGHEVTTPLSRAQWAFTYNGDDISLWPSVGNWSLPCRSHYIVDNGRVRWARTFSEAEIKRNRLRDRAALSTRDSDASRIREDDPRATGSQSAGAARRWQDRITDSIRAGVKAWRRQ